MALRMIVGASSLAYCAVAADPPPPANVALPWGPADCFVNKAFEDSEVYFEKNIEFGNADNPFKLFDKNDKLLLDVAFPSANDTRSLRPVLVWIHGGAFLPLSDLVPGSLPPQSVDNPENHQMVMTMATRGYVVVSMDYRVVPFFDIKELNTIRPPVVALEDARAAVRFVRKMASEWRIDTSRIAVGGDSAGAITAMAYGFTKHFSDGHSGNAGYSSSINSVLAVSGSMVDLAFCKSVGGAPDYEPVNCMFNGTAVPDGDLTDDISAGDIPAVMLHGTVDNIVPYAGALKAYARAQEVGVNLELFTIPGANHVPYNDVFNNVPDTITGGTEPYFLKWLTQLSGSLNLAEAECPSSSAQMMQV